MDQTVYKILRRSEWESMKETGRLDGAPVDLADGYIHLSTGPQVRETAARHFEGEADAVLLAVDTGELGEALRYEASRGGALFPHLYAPLPMRAVAWSEDLPLGPDGRHQFPDKVG